MRLILGLVFAFLSLVACTHTTTETPMVYDDESMLGIGVREMPRVKQGWSLNAIMRALSTTKSPTMQANFEDAPGAYTVQFTIDNDTDGAFWQRTKALITWSVEGNFVQRLIDVTNGTSISGAGQGVRVQLIDATTQIGPGPVLPGYDYKVNVVVVPGTRPATGQPPTLIGSRNKSIGPQASLEVEVPAEAGATQVLVSVMRVDAGVPVAIADGDIDIIMLTEPVGYPAAYNVQYTLKRWSATEDTNYYWMPLVPGTRYIAIGNNRSLAGELVYASVLFGIDG